jgi:ribosomal protein S27AE
MSEARFNRQLREAAELVVVWASSDGARCVLAISGGVLELRLEHDGEVLRRAHYIDIRSACDAAQQWRIDWDIESRSRQVHKRRILCPQCGDDAFMEQDVEGGIKWFRCASCGDTWMLDDTPGMGGS